MTRTDTLPAAQPGAPPPPPPSHHNLPAVESRGNTTIDDQVVVKIATRVVTEVEHVGGAARRVLGVAVGREGAAQRPQVQATVTGTAVTVDVRLSITYPAPVAQVSQRVRVRLMDRIAELTGLTVGEVDITVTALTTAPTSRRRELQ